MSADPRPDLVGHLESDFKSSAIHFEKTSDGAEVYYPETLHKMQDPPTVEMIKLGEQLQGEDQMRGLWASLKKDRRMMLMAVPYLIACIGQGYDGGASGITLTMPSFLIKFGAFDPVTKSLFIPSQWLSAFTGAVQAGITLGAFACSWLLDRFGPKRTNLGTSAFMLIPVAIQTLAINRPMLLVGKLLGGIPQGIFVVAASNYIAEASSIRIRGPLSALMAMQLIAGIVFGLTAGYERFLFFTSDWLSWRMVLAIQWVFPVLTVIGLLFVTDSPVYQLRRGNLDQSINTLGRLYPRETAERIRARLATIQHGVAIEQEAAAQQGDVTLKDLFSTSIDRRRTFISIGTWIVFQFGGSAFTSQGLYFLTQQGIAIDTVFTITICMIALSALVNLFSVVLLEKIGRRGCFVYLNMFHCLILTMVGALAYAKSHAGGIAMAILLNLAISTQQVATGGSTYAINSEVSSMRLRAKTQSVGLVVNYLLGMVFVFVVPYMFQPDSGNLGAKTAFIFAGLTFLGIVWSYICVPETKGRTALELDALFEAGVPARKFRQTDVTSLDLSGHGHHTP